MKSKGVAILIALFLGGFGGHKFYLGQTTSGILSLIFFWTGIPALIAIIDIIRFVVMPDETFNSLYNKAYETTK